MFSHHSAKHDSTPTLATTCQDAVPFRCLTWTPLLPCPARAFGASRLARRRREMGATDRGGLAAGAHAQPVQVRPRIVAVSRDGSALRCEATGCKQCRQMLCSIMCIRPSLFPSLSLLFSLFLRRRGGSSKLCVQCSTAALDSIILFGGIPVPDFICKTALVHFRVSARE